MKSKNLLLAKAVISIVVAFFMLFFARTFLNWFLKTDIPDAATLDTLGGVLSQAIGKPTDLSGLGNLSKLGFGYYGAMLVGVAIICYFASNAAASALRRNVMISLAIADTIGFVLALIAQLSGKFDALGWLLVAVWFLLALFLAYFGFLKPED